jgi:hypothetical protein
MNPAINPKTIQAKTDIFFLHWRTIVEPVKYQTPAPDSIHENGRRCDRKAQSAGPVVSYEASAQFVPGHGALTLRDGIVAPQGEH